jgi:hypothetical protein
MTEGGSPGEPLLDCMVSRPTRLLMSSETVAPAMCLSAPKHTPVQTGRRIHHHRNNRQSVSQKTVVVIVMLAILLSSVLLQGVQIDVTGPALWEKFRDLVTVGTTDAVLQVVQLQQACHGSTARPRINITTSLRGWHPCTYSTSVLSTMSHKSVS